jgi:NADPH-dependent curcumin reductase CurA
MGLKVCAIDFGPEKKSYALETLGCDAYVDIKDKKGPG